ncbi:hypothetical protein PG991_002863 [Apiospora marii]|uniref:Uncharacterized protein n=1 Tax=Apiospora marii TaxID=335849 RepID=A0ABR1SGK9_9PEZI
MSNTSGISRTNRNFNWETNDMGKTDEDTPYLEKKESILSTRFLDPLDEFLALPYHSPSRLQLPRLFYPLCSNHSISEHRSGNFMPLNQHAVWLDDTSQEGGRRDYSGVMTDGEFLRNLKLKRLGHEKLPDARIRRMHIPNPSHHTPGETGSKAFVMEFHLPYLAWRDQDTGSNHEDARRTKDGRPLRKLQDMSFLLRSAESDMDNGEATTVDYLYEAQSSCVITGYNNSYWTAISFSDTYFYPGANSNDAAVCGDIEDMLPYYDGDDDDEATDPLTIGNCAVPQTGLDPRHYFLLVLSSRLDKLKEEWDSILDEVSSRVSSYLSNPHITSPSAKLSLASTDGHARAVHESYKWVTAVMYLLEKLQVTLEKVIKAYIRFEKGGLVRFTDPESAKQMRHPIQEIQQSINELDMIHQNLSTLSQKARVFKEQIFYFGAPTLAAGLFQANIWGGGLTVVWFILVTMAITVLGSTIKKKRDGHTWSQILSSLTFGILPLRRGDNAGGSDPWSTSEASRTGTHKT